MEAPGCNLASTLFFALDCFVLTNAPPSSKDTEYDGETATSNDDATTQLLVGDKKLWSTSIELVQPLSLSCTPPQEDFVIEMVMEQRMSRGSFGAIQINELS